MTFKILPQVTLVLFGKLGEEVDRLIGLCQFLRQLPYLLFQQLYLPRLRIVISYWFVGNIACLTRILHRT